MAASDSPAQVRTELSSALVADAAHGPPPPTRETDARGRRRGAGGAHRARSGRTGQTRVGTATGRVAAGRAAAARCSDAQVWFDISAKKTVDFSSMASTTQVSAPISQSTRRLLEGYVQRTGKKKGRVIEDALRTYLEGLNDLPSDVVIPRRIVLTRKSGEKLLCLLESPPPPTPALRRLMTHGD